MQQSTHSRAPVESESTIHSPAGRLPPRAERGELESALRARLEGEVRFDDGSRALYASDLSIYRQPPIGIVIPRTKADVEATVLVCRERGVPILGRGTGTSLVGQCCNVAVVIDFSKYLNRLVELRPGLGEAIVEPGLIRDELDQAAARHGLTFAPDPATHAYCTLGGMIGNNSCGAHSVMGGGTSHNLEELEILTYDGTRMRVGATEEWELEQIIRQGGRRGEIYRGLKAIRDRYHALIRSRFPRIPRRVSGYNLDELLPEKGFHVARALAGTESTCALVLEAKVRLMKRPRARAVLLVGYPDAFVAADHVPQLKALEPIALEAFTEHVWKNLLRKHKRPEEMGRLLPRGTCWIILEFGGETHEEAQQNVERARRAIGRHAEGQTDARLIEDPALQKQVWQIREGGVGSSRVPHEEDSWPSWEDAAVAPERLGAYLRDFDALTRRYGYHYTLFGHFGEGCIHTRLTFNLKQTKGVEQFRRFMFDAADLVVSHGGSLSGEHGDGQAHGELLPRMFGPELMKAFHEFKQIWDPGYKMNPGKVIDAYPLDANLRTGPDYHPRQVRTHFKFPDDRGSFALATERCFGVGKCRRLEEGTMCPSFRVTREEKHTTRGRARLLFEMLRGEVLKKGWREESVKEALDLCLACKGCKGDCPVSVDVASYKAEFLSHYYEGRLFPRAAYAMGLVFWWARLGSYFPNVINFATRSRLLAPVLKALAGIASARELPPLAPQSFRSWFEKRGKRAGGTRRVLLWVDTFNNYFLPHTGVAAVRALEAAGYEVEIPKEVLCCGRPLYDYGMLELARRKLSRVLASLRPYLATTIPIVVIEPSCLAVFKDELRNLFPEDEDAKRLAAKAVTLAECVGEAPAFHPPKLDSRAVVHGHCHQKALVGMGAETSLLERMGVQAECLDSGCCGMAGSFGFERAHYDISKQIAEDRLLPKIRDLDRATLIVADGFSCREQIAQLSDRRALHTAEVLAAAYEYGAGGPTDFRELERAATPKVYGELTRAERACLFLGSLGAGLWIGRRLRARRVSKRSLGAKR